MGNIPLKKSAQNVQNFCDTQGINCFVKELSESTKTSEMAANTIGCSISQIIKSLVFKTKITQKPILILASGSNRVDEKAIKKHMGENIKKADADFIREITGYAIGGIPPFAHKNKIENVFIDEDLLHFESAWAAAGTPNAVFKLQTKDLEKLTGGQFVSVKKTGEK